MSEIREDILEEEKTEHFVIEDDQTADWAMKQIRNARDDMKKWIDFYKDRIEKVKQSAELTISNMESMLQRYFESVPHRVTATQENYTLPSGKLVVKKKAPDFEREDSDVIEWLKANGGERFIKTKEELDWAELKKTLNIIDNSNFVADENGEVIPGIVVVERPDEFKVELKKED